MSKILKKKTILFISLFITLISLTSCGAALETNLKNQTSEQTDQVNHNTNEPIGIRATVSNVVDGDTIDVIFENGLKDRVRLVLVDTPETKHPNKPVQPFGPEASDFTERTLLNQDVELELDIQERDRYGRLLAYVYIDEKMINEQLLENGLARVAVFPPNTKYVDKFRSIEQQAKKKQLGIWSIENYATEKGFEADETNSTHDQPTTGDCKKPTIKGNINSRGEKIYHVPGGAFYERTIAEQMFCTEKEAVSAGFRKSKR